MGENPVRDWSFLTHHAVVLTCIAKQPGSRARDVASAAGIRVHAMRRVIADLSDAGYITKRKEGRQTRYSISPNLSPRHDRIQESDLIGFLEAVGQWGSRASRRKIWRKNLSRVTLY